MKKELTGILKMTSRGFGFVVTGKGDDVFIPAEDVAGALDGDKVTVKLYDSRLGPNPEGRIVEIIDRKRSRLVGALRNERGKWLLIPDERSVRLKIPVDTKSAPQLKETLKVVCDLDYGEDGAGLSARIAEIIGFPEEPGADYASVCALFELPKKFPLAAERESAKMKNAVVREAKNRLDLRNKVCFTIDPVEAKDFDDAVSIEKLPNGNTLLGVHIADVSHYVREGTALDREAFKRGTSVYLINHVVPMLPEKLSNDICSLVPGEDRLAMSALMELDSQARLVRYDIEPTVIRSNRRFTYSEAQKILVAKKGDYYSELAAMLKLSKKLLRKRQENGSIDFDISEAVFRLDDDGIPYDVYRSERLDTHRLVEEFMLFANRTVARRIGFERSKQKLPFVYRVHDTPDREEVSDFLAMLKLVGVNVKVRMPIQPADFRNILKKIESLPEKEFLERVALRTMSKAVYSTRNKGHYALAFDYYTHFTSPIRRYPDLLVHRLLKEYDSQVSTNRKRRIANRLDKAAAQSNECELVALDAERAIARIKKVKFLAGKLGEEYEGLISGVTSFGLFVELLDFHVEGLIHIRDLTGDYYLYEPTKYHLRGRRTKRTFRLGDRVRIKVSRVNIAEREVDFSLIEEIPTSSRRRKRGKR